MPVLEVLSGGMAHRGCLGLAMAAGLGVLQGCAAIGGDMAYSAAFRMQQQDVATLPAPDQARLSQVQVLPAEPAAAFTRKGPAQGLACKLSVAPLVPVWLWKPQPSVLNGDTPQAVALTQLKLSALRAGGNAVLAPQCTHNDSIDWRNNCFETWICKGEAVWVPD
jgi:hypothetical protein